MCALGLDIDHVDRLACSDVQLVPLDTAETEVRTDLWELNEADTLALWAKHMDAIVAITDPASACPNIAFDVTADAVGVALALGVSELAFVRGENLAVLQVGTVHVINANVFWCAGIDDVELLVVG